MVIGYFKKAGKGLYNVGKSTGETLRKKYDEEVEFRKDVNQAAKEEKRRLRKQEAIQKQKIASQQRIKSYKKQISQPKQPVGVGLGGSMFGPAPKRKKGKRFNPITG